MKKTVKYSVVFILLLSIIFAPGCGNRSLPIYELESGTGDDENFRVTLDGVEYVQFPATKWHVLPGSYKEIGYAGSRKMEILESTTDTNRNFIFLNDLRRPFYEEKTLAILHRIDLSEPSMDIIDKITYYEQNFREGEAIKTSNTIVDKEIIKKLFKSFMSGGRIHEILYFEDLSISISCYSDAVTGAAYILNIAQSNGKLVCGSYNEGYVEIPVELFKKIAGYEIDVEVLFRNHT